MATTRPAATPARAITAALVVVCMAANAAFALHRLGSRSLWSDEGASWVIARQHGADLGRAVAHQGGDMLVYYLVLHVALGLSGATAADLRLPSALFGVAAVPLVYLLGKEAIGSRWAGIASSAVLAVSLPLVFWQQNARAYTLDAFLATATTLTFLLAFRDRRRGALVAWVVCTVLAVNAHPLAVLVLGGQLVSLALVHLDRVLWRRLLPALAMVGVGSLPLAVLATRRGSAQIAWLPRPTWSNVEEVATFLTGGTGGFGAVTGTHTVVVIVTLALWAWGLVGLLGTVRRHGRDGTAFGPGLLASGLFAPPVVAWAASFVVQPLFLDRYLIVSLPAGVVFTVFSVGRLRIRPVVGAALVVVVVLRLLAVTPSYGRSIEANRAATRYVLATARPGDCIGFYVDEERVVYDYYVGADPAGTAPRQVLPTAAPVESVAKIADLADADISSVDASMSAGAVRRLTGCRRVWLMVGHAGFVHGTSVQRANYAGLRRLETELGARRPVQGTTSFAGVELVLYGT